MIVSNLTSMVQQERNLSFFVSNRLALIVVFSTGFCYLIDVDFSMFLFLNISEIKKSFN